MSEFLTKELGHRDVIKVEKHEKSKVKCDLSVLEGKRWKIRSLSRGKELMLIFSSSEEELKMKISFARVGSIEFFDLDKIDEELFEKRALLRFYTEDRVYFVSDFTKLSRWTWAPGWDPNRGPDILTEHAEWREHMYQNRNHKHFKKLIFEVMCDQRFFNGIGNFYRSEILSRTRFSPFTTLKEVLQSELLREDFFVTCKMTLEEGLNNGGLQFEHWRNPFGISKRRINRWIRCYNKLHMGFFLKDSKGRKLWFMREWVPEYIKWVEDNAVQDTRLLTKIYKYKQNIK